MSQIRIAEERPNVRAGATSSEISMKPSRPVSVERIVLDLAPDTRPAVRDRKPKPAAYAALPLAAAADGVLYGGVIALNVPALILTYGGGLAILGPLLLVDKALEPGSTTRRWDYRRANLSGEDLSARDLATVSFQCARLIGVDLSGATLRAADLRGAILWRANLSGVDLSTARNLTQAQLDSACGDARTVPPEGLRPPPACAESPSTERR